MRMWRITLPAALALLLIAGVAGAELDIYRAAPGEDRGLPPFGLRLGYTSWENLEQVHFGIHQKLGEVVENVDFTPSLEFGLGGVQTVIALNGDLTYRFTEMVSAPWGMYGGASLALMYLKPDGGASDSNLGFAGVGGFTRQFDNGHEALLEVRVGILDSPGFKLTCGYTLF